MSETIFATATMVLLFTTAVGWIFAIHWHYKYLEMEERYKSLKKDKILKGVAAGAGAEIASGLMSTFGIGGDKE